MKNHDEIRSMLAALAGGDLSAADLALVEQHLALCQSCRSELAQLQLVVQAVRATPELEPPAWLASRTMARVREEAAQQQSWFARLFLPLRIKLPLEAFALVMICVTAWYVMQEVDRSQQVKPDLPQVKAPVAESAKDAAVQSSPQASTKSATVAPVLSKEDSSQPVKPGASPAQEPPTVPAYAPPPQAGTRADAEQQSASVADRAERMDRARFASGAAPAAPTASREQAAEPPVPMAERKMATKRKSETSDSSLNAAASPKLRLRMVVSDRDSFSVKLTEILQRLGGSVISSRPGNALVRIEASRLSDLLAQLAVLGRATEQPVLELNRTGPVELQIFW